MSEPREHYLAGLRAGLLLRLLLRLKELHAFRRAFELMPAHLAEMARATDAMVRSGQRTVEAFEALAAAIRGRDSDG